MPIYEYKCQKCGHEFEFLIVPTSDKPSCPKCKSVKLEQQLSMFAVSSEATREMGLRAARKRNKAIGKDKAHEEHKEYHKHMNDH